MTVETTNTENNYSFEFKRNPWRDFVSEMWYTHKDEIFAWTKRPLTEYDMREYYHNNKWFLRKKFRKENNDQKGAERKR